MYVTSDYEALFLWNVRFLFGFLGARTWDSRRGSCRRKNSRFRNWNEERSPGFRGSRPRHEVTVGNKRGMENETAAVEWKSYTRLRVTYHFPLIRISGTTIRNPAMFGACTVKYSEEVWLGVNQRWQPLQPILGTRCIAPTWDPSPLSRPARNTRATGQWDLTTDSCYLHRLSTWKRERETTKCVQFE